MLRDEKLKYQEELEKYMEENDVYDVFETMMKQLIIAQPSDPVPFLLDILQKPQIKRIFIIGPPGSKRKEHILTLAENFEDFKYEAIWVGDLLSKEVSKKSELGKKIVDSRKTYSYVPDDVVIELVTKQIKQLESENKSWIIEGFPRTRKQAIWITKMNFIPDHIILLDVTDRLTKERVRENLTNEEAIVKIEEDKIGQITEDAIVEYNMHIEGVKEVYSGMISVIDGNKRQDIVLQEIARIIKLKVVNAPKRCPKIVLIGPPGSGKTTQAIKIAEKLKIVHIHVSAMIKQKISSNKEDGRELWKLMREGDPLPDETYEELIKERLSQIDVKMNGFVLDGYPLNSNQMKFLIDTWDVKPSHLIFLEINDHKAYERLEYRLFDPMNGIYYDAFNDPPTDDKIISRLIHSPEDDHHVVKKCIERHKEFIMDIQKKLDVGELIIINADNKPETVFMDIASEIGF